MKTYKATQLLTFTLNKKIYYITEGSTVEIEECDYIKQLVHKGYLVEEKEKKQTEKSVVKTTKTKK